LLTLESQEETRMNSADGDPHSFKFQVVDVHKQVLPWVKDNSYLLCVHLVRLEQLPVKPPDYPEPMRQMMGAMQHMGMAPNPNAPHISAEANILLTPDQFEQWGRPSPGDTVKVKFEPERRT